MNTKAEILLSPDKYNWEHLHESFEWIRDMKGVPQSHVHHAEGDVWNHVKMVTEELFKLSDWTKLSDEQKSILFAAALLHDVEKRSTTVHEENGDITSRGHAKKGEFTARKILMDFGVPFYICEQIAKLVRYHGLPIWFFEKENPQRAVIEASMVVDTYLLSLLAEADMKGRICQDFDDMIMQIELFREYCKEQECYGQVKTFASDHSRFVYFNKNDSFPGLEIFDNTTCEVILMSGLPGAGKNTWIKNNKPAWPNIELDEIRRELKIKATGNQGMVIQTAKERAKIFLRNKQSFIWNATNTTRQMRAQLIELFASYGAKITIVFISTEISSIRKQNTNREAKVPERIIEKLLNKLEVPNLIECHKLLIE